MDGLKDWARLIQLSEMESFMEEEELTMDMQPMVLIYQSLLVNSKVLNCLDVL